MDVLTLDHLQARGHMTAVAASEPHFGRDPTFAEYGWHDRFGFYHPNISAQLFRHSPHSVSLGAGIPMLNLLCIETPHLLQKYL